MRRLLVILAAAALGAILVTIVSVELLRFLRVEIWEDQNPFSALAIAGALAGAIVALIGSRRPRV